MTTWWNHVAEAKTTRICSLANGSQIRLTIVSAARASDFTARHARALIRVFRKLLQAGIKAIFFSIAASQTGVLIVNRFGYALLVMLIVQCWILTSTYRMSATITTVRTVLFTRTLAKAINIIDQTTSFAWCRLTSIFAAYIVTITVALTWLRYPVPKT